MSNKFIWSDLSSFDLEIAKDFYAKCFAWQYVELDDSYWLGEIKGQPVAGLYTMPDKFQEMGMPSFWMSYIRVDDIHATVQLAEQYGAKVEVYPETVWGEGQVALIRDPFGAGFTCYQGEDIADSYGEYLTGKAVWHELYVSDLAKVENFYRHVFDWDIRSTPTQGRYEIINPQEEVIASIQVMSNDVKGDKEYWGVYFAVRDLAATEKKIKQLGGQIVDKHLFESRNAMLAYDSQGAAFYVVEGEKQAARTQQKAALGMKWRATTGLIIIALAVLLNLNWIWGLLFLLWVIPDIKTGSTHFLEHVERRHNPVIYWLIIISWIGLSLYFFLE